MSKRSLLLIPALLSAISCASLRNAHDKGQRDDGQSGAPSDRPLITASADRTATADSVLEVAKRLAPAPQDSLDSISPRWQSGSINTAAEADYMTATERQVVLEINKVRTDPAAFAREYLVPMRGMFQGLILQYPGEIGISTNEGIKALEECIKVLSSATPIQPLTTKKGMTLAARSHAADQAKTGAVGHKGADGSTSFDRMNRFGHWGLVAGENIDYGSGVAREIVIALLIDDGVSSRGHRKNLLNEDFHLIGVAVGAHPVYGHMCVIDLAGTYE